MMPVVSFSVYGEPSPQAGTRAMPVRKKGGGLVTTAAGRPITRQVTTGGVNLKSWRQEISSVAAQHAEKHGMYDGPIRLELAFRFAMPASRPKWAKLQRMLLRTSAPDLDKLIRAVGDSLKVGGLIKDDALICQLRVEKVEVFEAWEGCAVRITPLDQRTFNGSTW